MSNLNGTKILIVAPHFPPHLGGVENALEKIADGYARYGAEVRVVTSALGQEKPYLRNSSYQIFSYNWRAVFGHPVVRLKDIREHLAWCDLVHTAPYLTAYITSRYSKKPVILTLAEVVGVRWFQTTKNPLKASIFYLVERLVLAQKFSHVHAISGATFRDLLRSGYPREKVLFKHLGVDTSRWRNLSSKKIELSQLFNWSNKERIFTYFGRPGATKGLLDLLHGIALLKKRGEIPSDVKFGFILARNPSVSYAKVLRAVKRFNLGLIVKIVDSLTNEELPAYISSAYSVIFPSRTEGFGLSAAESCELGVRIIASNAGSLPEVVSGRSILFEAGSVKALTIALKRAFEDDFDYKAKKDFSWEDLNFALSNLVSEILKIDHKFEVEEKRLAN